MGDALLCHVLVFFLACVKVKGNLDRGLITRLRRDWIAKRPTTYDAPVALRFNSKEDFEQVEERS
jgi:hypothetical protein